MYTCMVNNILPYYPLSLTLHHSPLFSDLICPVSFSPLLLLFFSPLLSSPWYQTFALLLCLSASYQRLSSLSHLSARQRVHNGPGGSGAGSSCRTRGSYVPILWRKKNNANREQFAPTRHVLTTYLCTLTSRCCLFGHKMFEFVDCSRLSATSFHVHWPPYWYALFFLPFFPFFLLVFDLAQPEWCCHTWLSPTHPKP